LGQGDNDNAAKHELKINENESGERKKDEFDYKRVIN